jgi:hypothetical protein
LATAVSGKFYWCEASQGTRWLPFSVGGTYYPLGMYYSNGVTWEYSETPYQATLSEVNTGTNTDKFVSPYTFTNADKWGNYTLKTTTISTTSPLQGGGDLSANRTFSITQANATTDGYLSSADWNTFSGKGNGTVTSVGLTMPSAFTVTNSPIISSGSIAVAGSGTIAEYIRGDGTLATFPTLTGYVPYTGATTNVDLGTHKLTASDLVINHASGSGVAASITKGGSGEALTVVKSSGSGNAASITGGTTLISELHLTTDLADVYIASAATWNAKQNALTIGDITDVGTDGISITGGTGAIIGSGVNISQQVANATQNGYLSSTDWVAFNSANFIPKLSALETYRGININNNSTTVVTDGGVTMSSSASTTAQTVASTNFATKQIRLRYYASTVSGGRYTGTRGSALLWFLHGGFRYVCDFNISDTSYSAGCQQFYGLAGQTTDLAYGTSSGILVSTLTNIIGVGSEVGDTNLQVFHNDATGTATKVDLGVDFPSNRTVGSISTTVYSIQLYNEPMSTDVKYEVKNNETGSIASGTISTNLPLTSQGLNFFASRCMSTTSVTSTGQFDLSKLGVYSQL